MPVLPSNSFIASTLNSIKNGTPHIALYTSNPTASDTGNEVTGGSYERQPVTFGTITNSTMSNTAVITFSGLPNATVTHYGIKSASTGGSLYVYGVLNSPADVRSGDQIRFDIGAIPITLSGS